MSSDFDPLFRGKMYCNSQKANSKAFDTGHEQISWDENSKLIEVKQKGNHRYARNFKVKGRLS